MCRLATILGLVCLAGSLYLPGCSSEPPLVWHEEDGYRWVELRDWDGAEAGFEEVSRTGVTFVNTLEEESLLSNRHFMNGSGVAVGDVDGDGWADLYFARMDGPNVLYRNLGGWDFEDVTDSAGVAAPDRYSTGAVFADIEGDGDLDLLLTAMGGPNAAFLNDGEGRFTEATEELGLSSSMGGTSMALADVDGDGDLDLYVSNYKTRAVNDVYAPWEHAFERTVTQDENGYRIAPEFEEHYELQMHAGGLLRVERAEPNLFYLNDGTGRFMKVPLTGGAFLDEDGVPLENAPEDWTLTARFQDVNGDGIPDLYVCNDFQSPDYFWLGDSEGGFRAVSNLALRKTSFSTMSVDFSDIERDGDLDFFLTDMLSNDYTRRQTQVGLTIPMTTAIGEIDNRPQAVQNTLQLNRGDDTYAEIARLSGVAASDWTWSGLFMDVDLDGYEDLLLATGHLYDVIDKDAQMQEMLGEGASRDREAYRRMLLDYPTLPLKNVAFRNRGDLSFDRMPDGWGLGEEPDVSNALAFGDLDNDGDLDAVVNRLNDTAGLFRNQATAPRLAIRLRGASPNTQAIGAKIRVSGDGIPTQEKEIVSGGLYLSGSDPIHAFAARGDSLDVEIKWRDGTISRIEGVAPNRILEIYERGARQNTGEGTDDVERRDVADQTETTMRSSTAVRTDATGQTDTPGRSVREDENPAIADREPLFEDVSDRLSHTHSDAPFDDFEQHPLLRRRLSQEGPALAWVDISGNGRDDLVVGTGREGGIALYRNDGTGRFSSLSSNLLDGPAGDDVTGIVATPRPSGGAVIFAGVASYESGPADASSIHMIEVNADGAVSSRSRLPFGRHSIGPLALADLDGDGDLDLFAGGRLVPDRYPEPASSRIYVNEDGAFEYASDLSAPFREMGMVSGAALGDLDGDADTDIVLSTDWGTLRYFENDGSGSYTDRTADVGFEAFSGWWNGVTLGDFDGDGRLDVLATNWGWNGVHERLHASDTPVRLYYGDFDNDGGQDLVEAAYEPGMDAYVPLQGLTELSEAMPYVSQRMRTYRQFASASLRDIIGFRLDAASYLEANTLSHMVFLNRTGGDPGRSDAYGDALSDRRDDEVAREPGPSGAGPQTLRFEASVLPLEVQFAPAFAAVVSDFDADGYDDAFLSQNFFAFPMEIPRQDAGRGLLLTGDGEGAFTPVLDGQVNIAAYGEQRGAAAADYDADGRTDLVVSQNGAETKLFKNAGNPPGLRVVLSGPPANPAGMGAVVRLRYEDGGLGPARLMAAGSGYRSQSSATVVLGSPSGRRPASVVVTWPDGTRAATAVNADATEVSVVYEQAFESNRASR